jgi:hypothetical protein
MINHLNSSSPDCLHGEGDEAGDGVRDGQVEHKVVHICTASEDNKILRIHSSQNNSIKYHKEVDYI